MICSVLYRFFFMVWQSGYQTNVSNGPNSRSHPNRSAWSANRIRHVITRKPHAFIRNPIHIGSRYIARIISAQSLLTVIIRKDEKNVRSFLSRFAGNYSSIGKENQ